MNEVQLSINDADRLYIALGTLKRINEIKRDIYRTRQRYLESISSMRYVVGSIYNPLDVMGIKHNYSEKTLVDDILEGKEMEPMQTEKQTIPYSYIQNNENLIRDVCMALEKVNSFVNKLNTTKKDYDYEMMIAESSLNSHIEDLKKKDISIDFTAQSILEEIVNKKPCPDCNQIEECLCIEQTGETEMDSTPDIGFKEDDFI